jgi:PAS domain S-box-containing protein
MKRSYSLSVLGSQWLAQSLSVRSNGEMSVQERVHSVSSNSLAFLEGGGEMGALIRAQDWAATPLGAPGDWPQPLKTAAGLMLNSGYPMYIAWGEKFTQLYNDAYRPILGSTKHPAALGSGTPHTFAEIWEYIGPMFRSVMESGKASTYVDQLLPLNRHGFAEECYFVFSYSPILDAKGFVGGVFVTVLETTERVLRDRRQNMLRELMAVSTDSGRDALLQAATNVLQRNGNDVCFIHMIDVDKARDQGEPAIGIPFELPHAVACAVWEEPVQSAIRLPIRVPGSSRDAGMIEVGLSPRLAWDGAYSEFLEAVVSNLGALIAKAEALEHERRRTQELAEIDAAKTVFFSNVSHEFRTPLTLMLSPLRDLLTRPVSLSEEGRELATMAERNALRLLKLVNSLLDFSRIEAGRVSAQYNATDLAALTKDLASNFRSAVESGGLQLIVDCPQTNVPIFVDRDIWEKIVLNLLSNAFKFTFEGHIAVRLHMSDPETVTLRIEDTGEGIPASEIGRLFERFHRVDSVRGRSHEGTGIGLALVQELVHLHGGDVQVESTVGKGSTFTVTIPVGPKGSEGAEKATLETVTKAGPRARAFVDEAQSWVDGASEPLTLPEPDFDAGETGQTGTILVADDNPDMRRYIGGLLEQVGLRVIYATNGAEAFEQATSATPDIIVSDVMMPELDGLQLLAKLRGDPELATIPVILVSARAGEDETVAGVAAGADDYISKPFSARELVARVRTQLALSVLRREAKEAIEASERGMRLAQHVGRVATWELDRQSRTIVAPATKALWGIDPSDGYSGFLSALHPEDRPAFDNAVEHALTSRGALDLEFRIVRPDTGELRWIACRAEAQPSGKDGHRLLGVSFDITEQRKAEEALRVINSTLEAEVARRIADRDRLWKLSTDIMLVARFDGIIVDVNPAWTNLLGWREDELVGRSFLDLVHPDDIEPTKGEMATLSDGQVTFKFENRYRTKAGDYRWLTWTATPDASFIHAVGRDVTEDKRKAERLETTEAALRQAQKMDAIGQLSGGIAHDFNNVLGVIIGSLELIRRRPDDVAKITRLAETSLATAERAARLTNQLLTFSRAQRIDMKPVDPSALLTGMRELLTRTLGPSIDVTLDLPQRPVLARSDETQLEMAILNLAINARDAMPSGGKLVMRVAATEISDDHELASGSYLKISVTDTGSGMTPEVAGRALDPFFTTKAVGKGTGLGLSQAFGLCRQSGGALRILSAVGKGTTIDLILPVVDGEALDNDAGAGVRVVDVAKKVLVVDDDDSGREIACELLTELGLDVVPAPDGFTALKSLSDFTPDLILLDYAMPGMTGAQVAKEVRAQFVHLPIIFMSGYSDSAEIESVSDEYTVFLRKPVRIDDLQSKISMLLNLP